jgi:hypothetical protein
MEEESGAIDLQAGHATKVPQLCRAQCSLVPGNRSVRILDDQHHRDHWWRSGHRVGGRGGTIFQFLSHAHSMPDGVRSVPSCATESSARQSRVGGPNNQRSQHIERRLLRQRRMADWSRQI